MDRNINGGGILFYVRKDIAEKSLNLLELIFFFFWKLIHGKRWLVSYSYLPTESEKLPPGQFPSDEFTPGSGLGFGLGLGYEEFDRGEFTRGN